MTGLVIFLVWLTAMFGLGAYAIYRGVKSR